MTDNLAPILRKVRALLDKTVERGCTPEEAAVAAAKAQELIDRYKLNLESVNVESEHMSFTLFSAGRSVAWKEKLLLAVAKANGCYAWRYREKRKVELNIVGTLTNVQLTTFLFSYLWQEIEKLAERGLKVAEAAGMLHLSAPQAYSNNFKLGAVLAIKARLQEERERVIQQHTRLGTNSYTNALVRFSAEVAKAQAWFEQEAAKGGAEGVKKELAKPDVEALGLEHGYQEGRKIPMRKGLGDGAGTKLIRQ